MDSFTNITAAAAFLFGSVPVESACIEEVEIADQEKGSGNPSYTCVIA